jgi:predicted aldo/keto reductase-like oxidoreductase
VCPKQIEVADIFRFEMYYSAYGDPRKARRLYGELPSTQTAVECDACGSCEEICPHGLPIISKLRSAHTMLSS